MFSAGKKKYLVHRVGYETFEGPIEDGFIIDHINGNKTDNSLLNLQSITPSENNKKAKLVNAQKARGVKSFDTSTHKEKLIQSMNEAGKYFFICSASVRFVAERVYQTAFSSKNGHIIRFSYLNVP